MNIFIKRLTPFNLIVFIFLTLSSCSKEKERSIEIPKESNVILKVNLKSLAEKSVDLKEFFSFKNLKESFSRTDGSNGEIKNSGIDFSSTAYAFGEINGDINGYMALSLPLENDESFEVFLKEINKNLVVEERDNLKIGTIPGENNFVYAWNKEKAIISGQSATEKMSLKERTIAFFNLHPDQKLSENDPKLTKIIKESGDISFYMSFEEAANMASKLNPLKDSVALMNLDDTYLHAVCNFNKGEMVVTTQYHVNNAIAEKLSIGKEKPAPALINQVAGNSLISLFSISVDMNKAYQTLSNDGLNYDIQKMAKQSGLSEEQFLKTFSGDFIATLNGFRVVHEMPEPEYSVLIGIKNKTQASEILKGLILHKEIQKIGELYATKDKIYIQDKSDYWIVSSEGMKDRTGSEKLNQELQSTLQSNFSVIHVDLGQIPAETLDSMGPLVKSIVSAISIQSLTFSGTNMKDNVSNGKLVLKFKNQEQNGFISFINLIKEVSYFLQPFSI